MKLGNGNIRIGLRILLDAQAEWKLEGVENQWLNELARESGLK
jgi:hypothetical protein